MKAAHVNFKIGSCASQAGTTPVNPRGSAWQIKISFLSPKKRQRRKSLFHGGGGADRRGLEAAVLLGLEQPKRGPRQMIGTEE